MVIHQMNFKLTDDERELLSRRAKKEGLKEVDYLRGCMMMDALLAGDVGAFKMTGDRLRVKLKEKIEAWTALGIL